jgi:hypothetical protein
MAGELGIQKLRRTERLRLHGLIRKAGRTYNDYLTWFGKQVVPTGLKLRERVVFPPTGLRPNCVTHPLPARFAPNLDEEVRMPDPYLLMPTPFSRIPPSSPSVK